MPPLLHREAEAGRRRRPGGAVPAPVRRAQGREEVGADVASRPFPATSDRRPALRALKLQALVREHATAASGSELPIDPRPYPGGAALVRGEAGWVLLTHQVRGGLGGAMAWADAHGLGLLHVVTDTGWDPGVVARRAALFSRPPTVWWVDDRALLPAAPGSRPTPPELPDSVSGLAAVIVSAGAEPVVEHGVLTGEVAGLEVCRAVIGEDGSARLDVGLGAHDREAFRVIHGDGPIGPALAGVVAEVASHRRAGAPPHALNRLARERALRARLVADSGRIGLTTLAPAPPPVPRGNPSDPVPCVALGVGPDAEPVVVVCSAGVDLDVVPFAADARDGLAGSEARLLVAVPEGDDHPVTRRLAARLAIPAEVVPVPPERPDT